MILRCLDNIITKNSLFVKLVSNLSWDDHREIRDYLDKDWTCDAARSRGRKLKLKV
jgi:hypothetical protein